MSLNARADRRGAIGLLLLEALRGAERNETELEPQAFAVMAEGVGLLLSTAEPAEDDERRLCRELLDFGWELVSDAGHDLPSLAHQGETATDD